MADIDAKIAAGTTTPLSAEDMRALLSRYMPQIHMHTERAESLRLRVLSGDTQISSHRGRIAAGLPTDVTEADLADAQERLDALRIELRESEGWVMISLGMAFAEGIGALMTDLGKNEGWRPPEGSMLRMALPGLLNIAIDLHDQNYVRANP